MQWGREHNIDLWNLASRSTLPSIAACKRYAEEAMEESMKVQQKAFDAHWQGKNPWIDENWNEIKGYLQAKIKQTEAYRTWLPDMAKRAIR
jgi:penicillin-binding protein 1A